MAKKWNVYVLNPKERKINMLKVNAVIDIQDDEKEV